MASYASGFPQSGEEETETTETSPDTQQDIQDADDPQTEKSEAEQPLLEGLTPDLEKQLIELVLDFERESFP